MVESITIDNHFVVSERESFNDDNERNKYDDLLSDLLEHDSSYKNESGSYESTIGNASISFEYVKPKLLTLIKDRVHSGDNGEIIKKNYQDTFFGVYTDIREIKNLKIQNSESTFDLKKIFGNDNIKVYFNLSLARGSGFDETAGIIWLSENPLTRGGLLTLLHEVGHYINSKQSNKAERAKVIRAYEKIKFARKAGGVNLLSPDQEDGEIVLQEEEKAWWNAIQFIKLLAEDLKIDINQVIKDGRLKCIQNYKDFIGDILEKN